MKRHLGKLIAVAALLTIALLVQIVPSASEQQSWMLVADKSSQLPQRFTLLNWNIQKRADESHWNQQYQQLTQQHQPDLITLQEVNVETSRENPSNKPAVFAPNLKTDNGFSGLLTAGNDLPYFNEPRLSQVSEPLFATPKPTLYSYYKLQQQTLLLVNIHAINFVGNDKYRVQVNDLVKQVAKHDGAVIISGDFNSWSQDRLETLHLAMDSLGLIQVEFQHSEQLTSVFGNPLDHVFYSEHLQVVSALALAQFDSSDHTPMVVQFQLR